MTKGEWERNKGWLGGAAVIEGKRQPSNGWRHPGMQSGGGLRMGLGCVASLAVGGDKACACACGALAQLVGERWSEQQGKVDWAAGKDVASSGER
eukprot:208467-Chlamydomonas_euryale.AAC.1